MSGAEHPQYESPDDQAAAYEALPPARLQIVETPDNRMGPLGLFAFVEATGSDESSSQPPAVEAYPGIPIGGIGSFEGGGRIIGYRVSEGDNE